jgi:hypothetical protein
MNRPSADQKGWLAKRSTTTHSGSGIGCSRTDPPPGAAPMLQAFRPVFEREVFLLGGARGPIRRWPLTDCFDGLETAEVPSMVETSPAAEKSLAQG